jgi:glycosyltransferase involved in cell wall biosynthesis
MRVLVLSDNPLRTALGDGLRAFGLLRPLVDRHRFDLLCFARPDEAPDPLAADVFSSVTMLPFPSTAHRHWLRKAAAVFSLRDFRPQSDEMKAELARRIARDDVDLVLEINANMLLNLPTGELGVPLVVDSIDEALLRDLRDLRAAPWRSKPRLAYRTWMFWRYERATMGRATANVYVAEDDARMYRRFFPGRPASVVPNGVDTRHYAPLDLLAEPATLVFEGNMMFGPNVNTARRLALEILPLVRQAIPHARVVLVGRQPTAEVRALAADAVEVTGTVADVRPYLARGTVFACPMRLGSGIKNKILQAWAMGRPVVASRASLGGLTAEDDVNVVVRDDNKGFAEAVIDIIRNTERAAELGAAGRRTVELHYAWSQRARQFEAILDDAVRLTRPSAHRQVGTLSATAPRSAGDAPVARRQ